MCFSLKPIPILCHKSNLFSLWLDHLFPICPASWKCILTYKSYFTYCSRYVHTFWSLMCPRRPQSCIFHNFLYKSHFSKTCNVEILKIKEVWGGVLSNWFLVLATVVGECSLVTLTLHPGSNMKSCLWLFPCSLRTCVAQTFCAEGPGGFVRFFCFC